MIARIQQFTTLTLIALAAAWAWGASALGWYGSAAGGALLILFGYALFLGVEFLLLAAHGSDSAAGRPPASDLFWAWLNEVLRTPLIFCWRQPFQSRAEPDHLGADATNRRGVLLLHGFVCNRGIWNPWMKRLRFYGIPFVAIDLEPPFGSIDAYVTDIEAAVCRLEAATGAAPVVVAHSMGGLATRAWLATQPRIDRIHRVVTVGSPHHGTWLARFAVTRNGEEMQPESSWRAALEARERRSDYARFTCFYGRCDNIVFPIVSATLPGADNRHLEATAHVQMVYHSAVFDEVMRLVMPPSPRPAAGSEPFATLDEADSRHVGGAAAQMSTGSAELRGPGR